MTAIFEFIPAIAQAGTPIANAKLTGEGFVFTSTPPTSITFASETSNFTIQSTGFTIDFDNIITVLSITFPAAGTYRVTLNGSAGAIDSLDGGVVVTEDNEAISLDPKEVFLNQIVSGMTISLIGLDAFSVVRVKFTGPATFVQDAFFTPNGRAINLNPVTFAVLGKYNLQLFANTAETQQIGETQTAVLEVFPLDDQSMLIDRVQPSLIQPSVAVSGVAILGSRFTEDPIDRLRIISLDDDVEILPQPGPYAFDSAIPAGMFRLISDSRIALGPVTLNPGLYGVQLERELLPNEFVFLGSRPFALTVRDTRKPVVVFDPPAQDLPGPIVLDMEARIGDTLGLPTGVVDATATVYFTTIGRRPTIGAAHAFPPRDLVTSLPKDLLISVPTIVYAIAVDGAGNVSDPKIGFFNVGGLKQRLPLDFENLFINYIRAQNTNDLVKAVRLRYFALLEEENVPGVLQVALGYSARKSYLLRDLRRAAVDILHVAGLSLAEALAPPVIQFVNDEKIRVKPGREIFAGTNFPGNEGDITHTVTRRGEEEIAIEGFADDTYGVFLAPSLVGHSYLDILVTPAAAPPSRRFTHLAGTFDVVGGKVEKTSISNVIDPVARPTKGNWTDPDLNSTSRVPVKDIHWQEIFIAVENAVLPEDLELPIGDDGVRPEDPNVTPAISDDPDRARQYLPPSNVEDPLRDDTTPALAARLGDAPRGPKSSNFTSKITLDGKGKITKRVPVPVSGSFSIQNIAGNTTVTIDINSQTVVATGGGGGSGGFDSDYISGVSYGEARAGAQGAQGTVFTGPGSKSFTWTQNPPFTYNPPGGFGFTVPGNHGGIHATAAGTLICSFGNGGNLSCSGPDGRPDESKVRARSGDDIKSLGTGQLPAAAYVVQGASVPIDLTAGGVSVNVSGGTLSSRNPGSVVVSTPSPAGSGKNSSQPFTVSSGNLQGNYVKRETVNEFTLGSLTVGFGGSFQAQFDEAATRKVDQTLTYTQTGFLSGSFGPNDIAPWQQYFIDVPAFDKDGFYRLEVSPDVLNSFSVRLYSASRGILSEGDSQQFQSQNDLFVFSSLNPDGSRTGRISVYYAPKGGLLGDLVSVTYRVLINGQESVIKLADPPLNSLVTVVIPPQSILGPDSTTVEVIASIEGTKGTQANVRSAFTVDGTNPTIAPGAPASGYSIGETVRYSVVAPRRIVAVGQLTNLRTSIKMIVEAVNAVRPANKITTTFQIDFPPVQDNITGLEPAFFKNGKRTVLPIDPSQTTTTVGGGGQTIVTHFVEGEVIIQDPESLQVAVRILGSENAQGEARLHFLPSPQGFLPGPPTLPLLTAPTQGNLKVGDDLGLIGPLKGIELREDAASRTFYFAVRAIDDEDSMNVRELHGELILKSVPTVEKVDILVKVNDKVSLLEDLPTVMGPEGTVHQIGLRDQDTIEIVARPTGLAGSQFVARVEAVRDETPFTPFPAMEAITFYNTQGVQEYLDARFMRGVFNIDSKVNVLGPLSGVQYRLIAPNKAVKFQVDATSTVNISNNLYREFRIQGTASAVVQGVEFYYVNSRNPDDILPIQAGVDVNGTITGSGTDSDPFIIDVDEPEQFVVYARPTFGGGGGLAFVQTGYAYDPNVVTELYPIAPETWNRAFGPDMNVLTLPHPVPPGAAPPRPLTGGEIIIASGSTIVGGGGLTPGVSKMIELKAVAIGVGASENAFTTVIYIHVKDPAVIFP